MMLLNRLPYPWLLSLCSLLSAADFRPPATPLITHDPYFSIWSMSDQLHGSSTKHWTGATHSLTSLVRIDGHVFRLMGNQPRDAEPLPQTALTVLPTHTVCEFEGSGLHVKLAFLTPALPRDLDVLSRPASYLTWSLSATDDKPHKAEIYFDAGSEIVVNSNDQPVEWSRFRLGDSDVLRMGSRAQPMLEKSGDNLRIDWGYLYAVPDQAENASEFVGLRPTAFESFSKNGSLPEADDFTTFQPYAQPTPVLALAFRMNEVTSAETSRHLVLAYDDLFSIEYFHRKLRPYWRRNGDGAADLLKAALRDYEKLDKRSTAFDQQLMADLKDAGGERYSQLCALAYRQTLAAHKLVADVDGTPLYFSKENFSNGSIDTVDVTYPSSPFFLLFNTQLLKGQLQPILDYAGLARWRFPFAPHDIGRYPLANGQQYGAGEASEEDQMPVEESGNMLLMVAAQQQVDGKPDFARRYWPILTKWATYLQEKGLDPENQLCTDDFAGHLAHNANLSIKSIVALGAYAKLADSLGLRHLARDYRAKAKEFAAQWSKMADDGDHFRLAFDKEGTWSQKYNLVWDRLLHLDLFPQSVIDKELAFYKTHVNDYGLPLDNRADYTKIDWLAWTATLTGSTEGFEELFDPAYRFAQESSSRVPLTDWYDTKTAKQSGFQARSVVGGIFIQMLTRPEVWKKYSSSSASSTSLRSGESGR